MDGEEIKKDREIKKEKERKKENPCIELALKVKCNMPIGLLDR